MQVRIVTEKNAVILEHSQEGNGHEQIFSRQVASNTKAGQCNFQIIDTGRCMLWIGEFAIGEGFTIQAKPTKEELQLLVAWPNEPGGNYASVYEKPLLLFHIPFTVKQGGSSALTCNAGKGQVLLFSYHNDFSEKAGFPGLPDFTSSTYLSAVWRMDSHMASVLQHILYYQTEPIYRQSYLRIKSEELYLLLLQEYAGEKNKISLPAGISEKLQTADKMIRERLDENYSIESLAKILYLNSSNLQRYFKAYYGCTLHQYILTIKMEAAQQLLNYSNKTSKEISFELGYKTDANFSEAFKKYFGYPPGQLRKKNTGNT